MSAALQPEPMMEATVQMEDSDREALLREAQLIEKTGGYWKIQHVMAVLDIARSTVYDTPWLRRCRKKVGKRQLRFDPQKVREGGLATN